MNEKAEFIVVNKEKEDRIEVIRSSFSKMYDVLNINCKDNRETELAIQKLEEAQFWSIKGITRELDD